MARLQLLRCATIGDAPCVSAGIHLSATERTVAAQLDSGTESAAWRGRLGGSLLVGAGVSRSHSTAGAFRLLILIDRGAMMSGDRTAFTRIALKAWLAGLDSTEVSLAVAGFGGGDPARDVNEAPLGSGPAAISAVDRLPPPESEAATPLYSALAVAVQRIAREVRAAPGSRGGVLVVTAGRNEIGRSSNSSPWLSGADGLAAASAIVTAAGQPVWVIVLGVEPSLDDVRALAGAGGAASAVAIDPNALASRLAEIGREFPGPRQLTFGLGAIGVTALGRSAWAGTAELHAGGGIAIARPLYWRPPLLAMPVFQGVADSGVLSPALKEALLVGGNGSDRSLIALLLALVIGSLWLLLPRLVWVDHEPQVSASRDFTTRPSETLSRGAPEGKPRQPEDITHQTARRTAMHR
ncbi:MAG: hypothetical protein ACRELE_00370 [Gemmatimonadales bacterium]